MCLQRAWLRVLEKNTKSSKYAGTDGSAGQSTGRKRPARGRIIPPHSMKTYYDDCSTILRWFQCSLLYDYTEIILIYSWICLTFEWLTVLWRYVARGLERCTVSLCHSWMQNTNSTGISSSFTTPLLGKLIALILMAPLPRYLNDSIMWHAWQIHLRNIYS